MKCGFSSIVEQYLELMHFYWIFKINLLSSDKEFLFFINKCVSIFFKVETF